MSGPIDLAAIRARHSRKVELIREGESVGVFWSAAAQQDILDFDALLAEVERLTGEQIPDWMRLDAETALDVLPEIREDLGENASWPHVERALEKADAVLRTLSNGNKQRFPQSPLPRIPKRDAPMFEGPDLEAIRVTCCECPSAVTLVRRDLPLLASDDGWKIERDDETGRVLATCERCRQ